MLELAHVYSISIIIFTTPIDNKRNICHLKRKRRKSEKGLNPTFLCTQASNPYLDLPPMIG